MRIGVPKNANNGPKSGNFAYRISKKRKKQKMRTKSEIRIQKTAESVTFAEEDVQREKTWQTHQKK